MIFHIVSPEKNENGISPELSKVYLVIDEWVSVGEIYWISVTFCHSSGSSISG